MTNGTSVTDFFRNSEPGKTWRQQSEGFVNSTDVMWELEGISDKDSEKLLKLLGCINGLWEDARNKGEISRINGEKIFDNYALDRFISDLALLLDDIESRRHIKGYVSGSNAVFSIEVPLEQH